MSDALHHGTHFLLPGMNVKEAIAVFEDAEADALAVLDGPETRKVLGMLTEQYALRRYSEELERRRREAFRRLKLQPVVESICCVMQNGLQTVHESGRQ